MPPKHQHKTSDGYMTAKVRQKFIDSAIAKKMMPDVAHRMPDVVSLTAPVDDLDKPIHFWQLFSILGQQPVVDVVRAFYSRVFNDKQNEWFLNSFKRVGDLEHHVGTQASMWLDCFGAGAFYHGGEYRLQFHHQHNALEVMTQEGAQKWIEHMEVVLDSACSPAKEDTGFLLKAAKGNREECARVRRSINTFLGYFMDDYAKKFRFNGKVGHTYELPFGERNPAIGTDGRACALPSNKHNAGPVLRQLTPEQIRALGVTQLKAALRSLGVDISDCLEKADLVSRALRAVDAGGSPTSVQSVQQ